MKKLIAIMGVLTLVGMATIASADPLMPIPIVVDGAGQGNAPTATSGGGGPQIDWIVMAAPSTFTGTGVTPGGFLYLYQIEATSPAANGLGDISAMTLSTGVGTPLFFTAMGTASADLDVDGVSVAFSGIEISSGTAGAYGTVSYLGHTAPNYGLPASEDPVAGAPDTGEASPLGGAFTGLQATSSFGGAAFSLTWNFGSVSDVCGKINNGSTSCAGSPNEESVILWAWSPNPPVYGAAVLVDGAPNSPWSTEFGGGRQVPIPVPEPGSMLLLGAGLLGLGYVVRRMR